MFRRIATAALITGLACAPAVAVAQPAPDAVPDSVPAPAIPADTVDTSESESFYLPPETLPEEPGTLIRSEPITAAGDEGIDFGGALERIMYTSTTIHGDPVAVTGYLIESAREWEGEGPTPTVVFAPGTRGAGDQCAPSRNLDTEEILNSHPEFAWHTAASVRGMRVVVTDYIGLGTPGTHTYAHNTEQAHAVLDAARAALKFADVPADHPVGFWGFSQGGGASAAAAEHAADYAPELNIKGTYAGAPPASLSDVLISVDGTSIAGVLGYAIAGYSARDPSFAAVVDRALNEQGRQFVDDNADYCIEDSTEEWSMTESRTLTASGQSLSAVAAREPVLQETFGREQLGQRRVTGPILIGGSETDDVIANSQVQQLGRDYCEVGSEVYYRHTSIPSATSSNPIGLDHGLSMLADTPESLDFLEARFNGEPAPTNCGTY